MLKMISESGLKRFIDAQARDYLTALTEIQGGRKRSHWMWYIFPQIAGLGYSEMAKRFAIKDLSEAIAYLGHPVLGERLIRISEALLNLSGNNAYTVMGTPDDLKLRSSMTLFAQVPRAHPVFTAILKKYFQGWTVLHYNCCNGARQCCKESGYVRCKVRTAIPESRTSLSGQSVILLFLWRF